MKKIYEDSEIKGTTISRLMEILSEIKRDFGDIPVRIPSCDNSGHQQPICKIEIRKLKVYSGAGIYETDEVYLHGILESDVLTGLDIAYHKIPSKNE